MLMLSSMKREIMHFHFVVRDGNEMYSVMHVQSCCFTDQQLLSRTTPLGSFFVFVFVCHLTLDIWGLQFFLDGIWGALKCQKMTLRRSSSFF